MEIKRIFFSYSRVDGSDFALKLAPDLQKQGFDVWIDQEDIRAGTAWDIEIEKALKTCDCLIFIQSEHSVISPNVLDEVYYALDENKKVIPVIIHNSETPFRIKRLQYVNFINNYEKGLAELLNNLKNQPLVENAVIKNDEAKNIDSSFTKKYKWLIATIAAVIVVAVLFIFNNKKDSNISLNKTSQQADTSIDLYKTFPGNWQLVSISPEAKERKGYLKIEATDNNKVNIKSSFQFYYTRTNDTAFLDVFNGYAECLSCELQNEMKFTDNRIDIATHTYKILRKAEKGVGKAGDTVMNIGSNNAIHALLTLHLINKDSAIISVQKNDTAKLAYRFTVAPFKYDFAFKKTEE